MFLYLCVRTHNFNFGTNITKKLDLCVCTTLYFALQTIFLRFYFLICKIISIFVR
jgi:hypothetical protein